MADIFISYKREDQAVAAALELRLRSEGFSVFWDPSITAGEYFDEKLGHELNNARAVIVLWSEKSIKSRWVRAEAVAAFGKETLISARIDEVEVGFPFNTVQIADLRGWNLKTLHPGITDLIDGVRQKVGVAASAAPATARGALEPKEEYSWSTGLTELDQLIGPLEPGSLNVISGRPSMGKSALVAAISLNVAKTMVANGSSCVVLFFSLEGSSDELGVRMLAAEAGVSAHRFRRSKISKAEYERLADAAANLNGLPLNVDDTGAQSIERIEAAAYESGKPPGLIVIDRFSMISNGGARNSLDTAVRLKVLAKNLKLPIIVTAETSRRADSRTDRRPIATDVDAALEEMADCILGVYRESVYLSREEPEEGTSEHIAWMRQMDEGYRMADLLVLKQRNGPTGRVRVKFHNDTMAFTDLE